MPSQITDSHMQYSKLHNIGYAFLNKESDALILPYKQSGVHSWKWSDLHFVWWNNRACTCVYRLSFCLRRSVKNITVFCSFSYSCQQNALINKLNKPLSNCRGRNSGSKLLTLQTFRVWCRVWLFLEEMSFNDWQKSIPKISLFIFFERSF